jgi:hypothetical protein
MTMCDNHPGIQQWASESIRIPYRNLFTGKNTIYIPDFFILYEDANGKKHAEVIEVKPKKEMMMEHARSERDKLAVALNTMKWDAARAFCKSQGMTFRVVTEENMYFQGTKR